MKSLNFIRLMFFGIAIVFSVLVFSAPDKKESANSEQELEESKEKCEDKKVKSDMILWETIGRHLFSSR
jgi:hypothetical protein